MKIFPTPFNLAALRGAFAEQFDIWDQAVCEGNTQKAKRARRAIQRIVREQLASQAARLGGFYLFLDPRESGGLRGLNYIGIADTTRRPIGRRIEDRLKDDSSLDILLDDLDIETARSIITARLMCALPRSGQNYVEKHLAVAQLFRRSPCVLILGCSEEPSLIRQAEKLLIASAIAAGAPLVNVQHRRFKGTVVQPALELASEVIAAAGSAGLPATAIRHWRSALNALAVPPV